MIAQNTAGKKYSTEFQYSWSCQFSNHFEKNILKKKVGLFFWQSIFDLSPWRIHAHLFKIVTLN
jgi:hypothetical protein